MAISIGAHRPGLAAPAARDPRRPAASNAVLGMLIFLGTEAMFFAGLISAFLVLRAGAGVWPPPGQPRLPALVTAANTAILLYSGYTMWRALAAVRAGRPATRWLLLTGVLGAAFCAAQSVEWMQLLRFGWQAAPAGRGMTFYTLIAAHWMHVLGGLAVVFAVLRHARRGRYTAASHGALQACQLYWSFVVGVWPLLYALVYLS